MEVSGWDMALVILIMLVVGFSFGYGNFYFQVTKLGVCDDCFCESQRYVDQGCDYSPDSGWVCYDSGPIERVTP